MSADPRTTTALEALRPRLAYLVCATPRSGSTLLCELLAGSGVAGRPAEHIETLRALGRPVEPREYFAGVTDPEILELLPDSSPPRRHEATLGDRLAAMLREATTPNGVFGTKVMWAYMSDLQDSLAEIDELAPLDEAARIAALLGDVRYLHVSREDGVAQAISLWRAVQTHAWRADDDDARDPIYSFAGIDHLVRRIAAHDRAWTAWFERHGIIPRRLSYDQIAGDPGTALRHALEYLGVADEMMGELPPEPPLRRQAGAESQEWAQRYEHDREARR